MTEVDIVGMIDSPWRRYHLGRRGERCSFTCITKLPSPNPGSGPFRIDTIQTDNGAQRQTAFHWQVLDKGFRHTFIKPATSRRDGKVECSHRIA